ncbi:hypothetical protein ACI3P6_15485 [Lacticaseibacillus paracasei]|uniref:hypothetical protein n=1 Tax=Lactobacillaceae TaxID=33958 RepID=UPI001C1E2AB2|nr:hypothetical protein [Lactobacillus helveticus]MBU5981555.1 hypothetical protein [Lactobacillus helveticus]MCT3414709.1 hypothetical protein [Lactobacillus helveticus]
MVTDGDGKPTNQFSFCALYKGVKSPQVPSGSKKPTPKMLHFQLFFFCFCNKFVLFVFGGASLV